MPVVVDTHQHFYDPAQGEYPWLDASAFEPVRRPFAPSDLEPELASEGVDGTVLVQTWSSREETERFLQLAAVTPWVLGVVGWVDLTAPDVADQIAILREGVGGDRLVGIRHQVHDEADPDWLERLDVARGLAAVEAAGLVYDLLIRPIHLRIATRVAQRFERLRFVVDHLAKPDIRSGEREPWSADLHEISRCPNVFCKASGLVTEADWQAWKRDDIAPYVTETVEHFGADRVMFGSDWPVCLVAATYGEVVSIVMDAAADLGAGVRAEVMGGTAIACYGLRPPAPTIRTTEPERTK